MLDKIRSVMLTQEWMTSAEISIKSGIPLPLLQPMLEKLSQKNYIQSEMVNLCSGCDFLCVRCDKPLAYRLCAGVWSVQEAYHT